MRENLDDITNGFCSSFPENHSGSSFDVLRVLDEAEATDGLLSRSQVLLVHLNDGGCLSRATTVDCVPVGVGVGVCRGGGRKRTPICKPEVLT